MLRPSLTPVHPSSRCSGHALLVPARWLAAKTPAWIESGSWPHIHSCLPRWLWAPHPYSVCTGQRVKAHRERVKKGFNKQIGQTAVIRHPAQSYKHTDQQCFTCNWPLLYTSLPRPSLFRTSPLPKTFLKFGIVPQIPQILMLLLLPSSYQLQSPDWPFPNLSL